MNLQYAIKQATNPYTRQTTERATDQDNESAIDKATSPDFDRIIYWNLRGRVIRATRQPNNLNAEDSVEESLK